MAKEIESSNEPSQSSSALPPLADNEVELVIDRFWRDTRPRVCVRSETKMVNGFNFRLLVWPQGSKQSQSHLSAFVEVVPPSANGNRKDSSEGESSSSSSAGQYPPDWACPCVFYRISVMNFKQKYPYSKADTWTFSYVCPDRGWHTLLDTRYINRRDGYLSNEGSLVIRAIAFPRFGHSVSVLPLLNNINHSDESSPPRAHHFGLTNILATDHINCVVQSLFSIPGFRKLIYSLRRRSSTTSPSTGVVSASDLETVGEGLKSCIETIKEIMARVTSAAPDVSGLIQSEFYNDSRAAGLCHCEGSGVCDLSTHAHLTRQYGRCRVLINCLEESLYSVSQSLFGRKRSLSPDVVSKRAQFDAYRHIVRDCKRILATVGHPLFISHATTVTSAKKLNLIEELQLVFAKLEYGADLSSETPSTKLVDTRGLVRELGLTNGGLSSAASPDGAWVVFFDALKKSAVDMISTNDDEESASELVSEMIEGISIRSTGDEGEERSSFTHLRFSNSKSTTIEKHLNCWSQLGVATGAPVGGSSAPGHHATPDPAAEVLDGPPSGTDGARFAKLPKILNLQFLNKVKDRMDVSERIGIEQYCHQSLLDLVAAHDPSALTDQIPDHESEDESVRKNQIEWSSWDHFLQHACVQSTAGAVTAEIEPLSKTQLQYRLQSVVLCSGEVASGHYSVVTRNHRMGGWTRFDDAWREELIDVCGVSGSSTTSPDWVFSPEWSCSAVTFVREDAADTLYARGVDVRLIRPDLFARAVEEMDRNSLEILNNSTAQISPLLCNRVCPPLGEPSSRSGIDPSCQVEICLITERDVVSASPGGFSVPFSFCVPNVSRKLIVRKDIQVDRLMKAVTEHFRIPLELQRLLALRYYPETAQERFELMQPHRSILAYLPVEPPGKDGGKSKSATTAIAASSLFVLVSAKKTLSGNDITVWVKIFDELTLAIVSVCLLAVDPNACLKDYFPQVTAKAASLRSSGLLAGITAETQFIVFEEVGPRQVELRRSANPVKTERILDGDVLIFVPLTDAAKRALIGSACGAAATRPKRRVHQMVTSSVVEEGIKSLAPIEDLSEEDSSEFDSSSEDHSSVTTDLDEDATVDVNERCRRFLSRAGFVRGGEESARLDEEIDQAYEELILSEIAMEEAEDMAANADDPYAEMQRRFLRDIPKNDLKEWIKESEITGRLSAEFRPPTGSQLHLFDGMTKEELAKSASGLSRLMKGINKKPDASQRRLDVPIELKDELSRIPCPMCFYCQLPLSGAKAAIVPPAKVSCTAGCVGHPLVYHDRCVQDLVRETGSDLCIITGGCDGRILVEPKSVIQGLVKRESRISPAALRRKLATVLSVPTPPSLGRGGVVTPSKSWSGKSAPPPLPAGMKVKKANGSQLALPTESLWWNACLVAFGGIDNLQSAVVEKQWDAAHLAMAKNVFHHWGASLLEKQAPKKQPPSNPPSRTNSNSQPAPAVSIDTAVNSSESSSDDDEDEPVSAPAVAPSVQLSEAQMLAPYLDSSDDEGFILVGGSKSAAPAKKPVPVVAASEKPLSATPQVSPTSVVIPQGFLGQPVSKEVEEERADKAAASIAEQTVSSILSPEMVEEDLFTPPSCVTPALSISESISQFQPSNSLFDSRMGLLPVGVRQYCLPVELVFVYYSEQFFKDRHATTVSLIPQAASGEDEDILEAITLAAFNMSAVISRLFTSPHQTFPDSPVSVQWFVEFETEKDSRRFNDWVVAASPEWGPECGALLPASMLGFAV